MTHHFAPDSFGAGPFIIAEERLIPPCSVYAVSQFLAFLKRSAPSVQRYCRAGMSTISKVVLGISVVLSVGTVVGVHVKQRLDRERLREGVLQDLERQSRKQENLRLLEEQIHLTKRLEAEREKILLTEGSSKF
ncbi:hypothetical protein XELAEV_18026603mg [Xenopus laevis]|uniref:Protein PET117 homolog, mitochondrial n=2 Tax=Xenopus laevis TaxID=8355 RepID=A0A974CUP5_XENLA|nr:hypothetical protein XELAEV_18026603mg [Xenopus laevis]